MDESNPQPSLDFDASALLAEAGWVQDLARRLTRDPHTAGDVAQGALTLAMEKRPAARASLRPWLSRVVATLAMHERRGSGRRRLHETRSQASRTGAAPGADELALRVEAQQLVAEAVCALPEPYRDVLLRRYYDGQSYEVIAAARGQAASTVRSQLTRGLERLRARFEEPGAQAGSKPSAAPAVLLTAAGLGRSSARIPAAPQPAPLRPAGSLLPAWALLAVPLAAIALFSVFRRGVPEAEVTQPHGLAKVATTMILSAPGPLAPRTSTQPAALPEEVVAQSPLIQADGIGARLRLLTRRGEVIPGARLAWSPRDGGSDLVAPADADGYALLMIPGARMGAQVSGALLKSTRLHLRAEAPGFAQQIVEWSPPADGITALGHVELRPGGTLTGRVLDERGRPVQGAWIASATRSGPALSASRVRRGPAPNRRRVRVRTDADGRFICAGLEPGERQLWVRSPLSHWTLTEPQGLAAGERIELDALTLEPAEERELISGSVLRGGLPVAGAEVGIHSHGSSLEPGTRVVTGADGTFRYAFAESGGVVVAASFGGPDGGGSGGEVAMASAAQGAHLGVPVVLELEALQRVEVTVVDESGGPLNDVAIGVQVADQEVLVALNGRPQPLPLYQGAWSDQSGAASLYLPPGAMQLVALAQDFETEAPVPLGQPLPASLVLRLKGLPPGPRAASDAPRLDEPQVPVRLRGTFRVDGELAAGWRAHLRPRGPLPGEPLGQAVTTQADGRFEVRGLPGDYDVVLIGELEGRRIEVAWETRLYSSRDWQRNLRTAPLRWTAAAPLAKARLVRGDLRNGMSEVLVLGRVREGINEVRAPVGMAVLQAARSDGDWGFVGVLDVVPH